MRRHRQPREWVPAGEFLALRIEEARNGGDWRGEWIEADIIGDLKAGSLTARGRRLAWRQRFHVPQDELALIPGSDGKPERLPVIELPITFWEEFIFYSGTGEAIAHWPESSFVVRDDWWEDVEIRLPPQTGSRRGPRPRYDWSAFDAWALERLAEEGGYGDGWTKSDAAREAADWALKTWGREPSRSMIMDRLGRCEVELNRRKSIF